MCFFIYFKYFPLWAALLGTNLPSVSELAIISIKDDILMTT